MRRQCGRGHLTAPLFYYVDSFLRTNYPYGINREFKKKKKEKLMREVSRGYDLATYGRIL